MSSTKILGCMLALGMLAACGGNESESTNMPAVVTAPLSGQSGVSDAESAPDIVKVAVSSKDHSTLVQALKAAEYVDALSNAGPFTVFAPTNEAFAKLPAGTVDDLLKPENKDKLRDILEYHVSIGGYKPESLQDGQILGQANSKNITVAKSGDKITINGANVLATVTASNGIVYVIDAVLLPPTP